MAATNKDSTVAEKLRYLYELQLIDSQLDEIAVLKGELPIQVKALEDEIAGLGKRISRLETDVKETESQIKKIDGLIADAKIAIEKYQKQMDAVKNNREYEALQKEIELQTLDIQVSEKRQNSLRRELEARQESLQAAREGLENANANLERKRVDLDKIVVKTEKDEKKLRKDIEAAREHIEDRLLKAYDKIRSSYRNGLAVVHIERNACGGCFNQVPPQTRLEIGMHKKIIACEHCGRIQIDDALIAEVRGEVAPE